MSFLTGTQMECLYSLGTAVTKNNYSTQAIMSAPNTQARAIVNPAFWTAAPNAGVGKTLFGHVEGIVANTAAATLAIALLWDPTPGTIGTTLGTVLPATAPTAATTVLWSLDFWITSQAVGGGGLTLQTNANFTLAVVASGTSSTAPVNVRTRSTTTALNSEAQACIELAGTWSAAAAGNTTTIDQFNLFGCN